MGIFIKVLTFPFLASPVSASILPPLHPHHCFLRLISWLFIFLTFYHFPWKFYSYLMLSFQVCGDYF